MLRSHFINGTVSEKQLFRRYPNLLTRIKTFSKKIYFEKTFDLYRKNPRKTWENIRLVIPNKPNRQPSRSIKVCNAMTENNETISNHLLEKFQN